MISNAPQTGEISKPAADSIYIPKSIKIAALNGSARTIYRFLVKKPRNGYKVAELQNSTKYSTRTIRYALKHLQNIDLIEQIPDMSDLRSHKYRVR